MFLGLRHQFLNTIDYDLCFVYFGYMGAMMYGMPKIWSSSYGKPRSTKHYKFVVKSNTNRNFGKFAKGLYKEDNDSYV